ncbi:DUF2933 domain-containing protein [Altericroceibacterium spongiae]|jgi:hypothetical protein|nr:DUF2933 domain-containing protein [Altericroceibacterium spongiae]
MVMEDSHGEAHTAQEKHRRGFWKSRAGTVFLAFLVLIAFLLAYEHRAHIFTGTGLLLLIVLLCPAMHLFMHHGHGGHDK